MTVIIFLLLTTEALAQYSKHKEAKWKAAVAEMEQEERMEEESLRNAEPMTSLKDIV